MAATSDASVDANAANPAKVTTAAGTVEQVPVPDQIENRRFQLNQAAKKASRSVWAGCRISKAVPPSTIGQSEEAGA